MSNLNVCVCVSDGDAGISIRETVPPHLDADFGTGGKKTVDFYLMLLCFEVISASYVSISLRRRRTSSRRIWPREAFITKLQLSAKMRKGLTLTWTKEASSILHNKLTELYVKF